MTSSRPLETKGREIAYPHLVFAKLGMTTKHY